MFERNASQSRLLKDCLSEALLQLMEEKPFARMGISELCEKAGVSRMAYCRNFASKEDVLRDHLEQGFAEYMEILSAVTPLTPQAIATGFFRHFGKDGAQFLERLMQSGLSWMLLDRFGDYLGQLSRNQETGDTGSQPYANSFIAGGLYKLLLDRAAGGYVESPEEMGVMVASFGMGDSIGSDSSSEIWPVWPAGGNQGTGHAIACPIPCARSISHLLAPTSQTCAARPCLSLPRG